MLTGDAYSSLMKEFIGSRALIFITGALALVAGLAVVNAQQSWCRTGGIVTILGWLLIVRGVSNLVFPGTGRNTGDRMIASHGGILAGAAVTIVFGAILSIMGYEDLWNSGTRRHSPARASSSRKRSAKRPRRK
jgi:hypothetical protein